MLARSRVPTTQTVLALVERYARPKHHAQHQSFLQAEQFPSSTLRFALAALLLPQLPTLIWCLQTHSLIYLRGWVNLEYFLALALAIALPNRGTLLLATLEMCLALVEPLAHLYYFHLDDVVSSLRYLIFLPAPRLLEDACFLIVYAAVTWFALRFLLRGRDRRHTGKSLCLLAVIAFLALAVDVGHGRFARFLHFGPGWGDADLGTSRIVRLPVASLAYGLLHTPGESTSAAQSSLPLASVLSQSMAQVSPGHPPDVVLVLAESWGLATDTRITTLQTEAYRSSALSSLYRIQTGHLPFSGSTTSGETRELCGNAAGHASLSYSDAYFAQCWPARFKQQGYFTRAVHGFAPTMFRRGEWYRRFGFDQQVFGSDLRRGGAATCNGAFPGICDGDVAHWIGSSLLETRNQRPQFVHWVTLNSHLPVPALDQESSDRDCVATGTEHEQSLCSWSVLVRRLHESVARLAATPGLRPTVFVIVGDHAPPFMRTALRDRFSQTEVPYVVLVPRSLPESAPGTALSSPAPSLLPAR